MKIICLHHAGGSSFLYSGWEQLLDGNIVVAIDLPGHGKKITQKLIEKYENAIDYLYKEICKEINESYIIFGHSMGAEMLLHIVKKMEDERIELPKSIVLSGIFSRNDVLPASNYSDEELIDNIYKFGGIQKEFLETKEFLKYFFPIIKADFNMIEKTPEYCYNKNEKYNIYLFNGLQDDLAIAAEDEWCSFFDNRCEIYHFNGNHFYLANHKEDVCRIINSLIINKTCCISAKFTDNMK